MRIHDGLTAFRQSFRIIRKQKRSRAQKWRVYYFIKRILLYHAFSASPPTAGCAFVLQIPVACQYEYPLCIYFISKGFFIFIVRCAAANSKMKQFCRMWGCEKHIRSRSTKLYSCFFQSNVYVFSNFRI